MTHGHRHGSNELFLICMAVILFAALSYVLQHAPSAYDTASIAAPQVTKTYYCVTVASS